MKKKEFKKMSDEIVNVKYPNRNAPSLVFNSFASRISDAKVIQMIEIAKSELHTSECIHIDNERVTVMKNLKYKLFVMLR